MKFFKLQKKSKLAETEPKLLGKNTQERIKVLEELIKLEKLSLLRIPSKHFPDHIANAFDNQKLRDIAYSFQHLVYKKHQPVKYFLSEGSDFQNLNIKNYC